MLRRLRLAAGTKTVDCANPGHDQAESSGGESWGGERPALA